MSKKKQKVHVNSKKNESTKIEIQVGQSRKGLSVKKYMLHMLIMVLSVITSFTIMFYVAVKEFNKDCTNMWIILLLAGIFAGASCFLIYFVMRVIEVDINNRGE